MTTLYRAIDLTKLVDDGGESSEPVQYVGVYVLRWGKQEHPSVGFIPVDDDMATFAKVEELHRIAVALEKLAGCVSLGDDAYPPAIRGTMDIYEGS